MTAIYIFCVANALIIWAYRSLYEDFMQISVNGAPGWRHYAIGFVLCFVPVLNILTGLINLQWALMNRLRIGAK